MSRGNRCIPDGMIKNMPANAGDIREVQTLRWEDPLEEGIATQSNILAWRISWTEELGATVHRVTKNWTQLKRLSMHACTHWWFRSILLQCRRCRFHPWVGRSPGEGNGNPLQYSCLGNPRDRGAWQATVHGVPKGSGMT